MIRISQGQILRSSRDRVLTGLIGGLSRYLGLSPGVSRLIFLVIFVLSILVGLWLLFLAIYILISAVIPRDDDPEDLRVRGFVIKVDRLILSLVALILLGVGIAVLIYSLALLGMSFGIHIISIINPPMVLAGILAFIIAVLGIIVGLAITWLGLQIAKRV